MKAEPKQEIFGDMPAAEFERALEQFCGWVLRYRSRVDEFPVLAQVKPGDVRNALPATPPEHGEPVENWLADLDRIILPGITHWNHPGFMAYFANTGSGPGILGELACAAINANGMLWKTSPAVTELEQTVLRWLAMTLGFPADWFGMFADTASTSTLVALAAAREATGLNIREEGLAGKPQLVLYFSEEAHSSVDKAGLVLGIGQRGLRRIPADKNFRMRVDALETAIREDIAAGRKPFAVVATVGTTSATAVDPVAEIAQVAREHNLWLHVDAAYAGSAAAVEELRHFFTGCELADSLVMNPHKWLFAPMDMSVLFTPRPDDFKRAFSLVAEYLRTGATDATDYMNYTFQLGRRFRALKLWFIFRYFGTQGIAARIREHCRLAGDFAKWVDADAEMERLAPTHFSVVCFRVHPRGVQDESELERINAAVLEKVNASGGTFLSHSKLKGMYCLRIAIGNLQTDQAHVRRAFELVREAAGL
jgi:aromatic-L-amino-acid decarboxylase